MNPGSRMAMVIMSGIIYGLWLFSLRWRRLEDHILSTTSVIQQADYKDHFKKYLSVEFSKPDTSKVRVYYRDL